MKVARCGIKSAEDMREDLSVSQRKIPALAAAFCLIHFNTFLAFNFLFPIPWLNDRTWGMIFKQSIIS